MASKRTKKRKPDGTDQENAIMHDCSLRVIVLWRRNEPQSTKTSRNSWGVFIPYPKLYTPSTLNIDFIQWHTQLNVCAVK